MQNPELFPVDWLTNIGEGFDPRVAVKVDSVTSGNDGDVTLSFLLYELLHNWTEPFCLDIGADKGWVSLFCAKYKSDAKVLAFEPTENGFELLKANTKEYPAITCHNVAISDKKGELPFRIDGSDSHSRCNPNASFPCAKLDEYIKPDDLVHIAKIDTEGHEYTILKAIEPILPRIASIVIEWSVFWYGSTPEECIQKSVEMFDILEKQYSYLFILSRRWPPVLLGPIQTNDFERLSRLLYETNVQVDILASIVPIHHLPIHSIHSFLLPNA